LKVLELFAGTGQLSAAFRARGHKTFEVDWNEQFDSDLHIDIGTITTDMILQKFGIPDVVWIAFDCTSFSLAAISHHRKKNPATGNLDPISDYAKFCDKTDQHVLSVLEELRKINPKMLFFIENPRACLQKMTWMQPYEKYKYLISYCKYETDKPIMQRRAKPTNIWTNHPNPKFLPPCKNGEKDHAPAPRGSKSGTQGMNGAKERSTYPKLLIEHIVDICEEYYGEEDNGGTQYESTT
jgi:site-specific DNA-cytosine methylase